MLVVARWGGISDLQQVRRIMGVWRHPREHLSLSRNTWGASVCRPCRPVQAPDVLPTQVAGSPNPEYSIPYPWVQGPRHAMEALWGFALVFI